jgi:hypothetical protein
MTKLLDPMPSSVLPGSGYFNDWFERLRVLINSFANGFPFTAITGLPTTLAGYGITDGQVITDKNQPNGYAGLNADSRIVKGAITTDDLIVDNTAKGLVLKSPNGHYWRISVSNAGALSTTDLGTTAP